MIIADALRSGAARLRAAPIDSDDAELEAEVLLRHALDISREALYARLREPIGPDAAQAYERLLTRRLAHEPTPYITGRREFYGLKFACTPAALIPRPETELLVEYALAWLGTKRAGRRTLVADVGTGSGAIAVAIAVHAPDVRVVAIDRSGSALLLARENARTLGVGDRIAFVRGDLLGATRARFDAIVANLPYIPTRTYRALPPEIVRFEPEAALRSGRSGTTVIEALLQQVPEQLAPDGLLLAEHAWNQGRRLRDTATKSFAGSRVKTVRDLGERDRMLVVEPA